MALGQGRYALECLDARSSNRAIMGHQLFKLRLAKEESQDVELASMGGSRLRASNHDPLRGEASEIINGLANDKPAEAAQPRIG